MSYFGCSLSPKKEKEFSVSCSLNINVPKNIYMLRPLKGQVFVLTVNVSFHSTPTATVSIHNIIDSPCSIPLRPTAQQMLWRSPWWAGILPAAASSSWRRQATREEGSVLDWYKQEYRFFSWQESVQPLRRNRLFDGYGNGHILEPWFLNREEGQADDFFFLKEDLDLKEKTS